MTDDKKIQWTLDLIQKLLDANIGKPEILQNIKNTLDEGKEISEGYKKYLKDRFNELHGQETSSNIDKELIETQRKETVKTKPSRPVNEPKTPVKPEPTSEYCRNCGNRFSEKSSNFCSKCGDPREKQSESFCKNCGQKLFGNAPCSNCKNLHSQPVRNQRPPEWKSERTTLVLSLVLGLLGFHGAGHIYVGKIGKGFGLLIISITLLILVSVTAESGIGIGVIFSIIYIIVLFWQIFNSRTLCRRYNDYLEKHGKKPW